MNDIAKLENLIVPTVRDLGFRLVRIMFAGGHRPTLQIMAEPVDGRSMTVEDCALLSRQISAVLDVRDPIPGAYQLEVSSPGIDRPLITRDDYRRFAGFEAKIELDHPRDGRKRFRGRILPVDDEDCVTVVEQPDRARVPFGAIAKAKLVITDDLLEAVGAARIPPPAPDAEASAARGGPSTT